MRLPRTFVDQPLVPGETIALPAGAARHLTRVLRLGSGDQVLLFNGDGRDYLARLIPGPRESTRLAIESTGIEEPAAPLSIRLAIGVSRGERMDFVIQKAVELGVAEIQPLFTERSMVQLREGRLERRQGHWQGVMIGACEQSGRRRIPRLSPPERLCDWLPGAGSGGILLDPDTQTSLVHLPPPTPELTLLVGPEGGLSERERALARDHGLRGARLGPRILRTETAPLAALAVIQALWGDLGR
jgi:16S rRNA (uracil1498-N3)-methyltransferase